MMMDDGYSLMHAQQALLFSSFLAKSEKKYT